VNIPATSAVTHAALPAGPPCPPAAAPRASAPAHAGPPAGRAPGAHNRRTRNKAPRTGTERAAWGRGGVGVTCGRRLREGHHAEGRVHREEPCLRHLGVGERAARRAVAVGALEAPAVGQRARAVVQQRRQHLPGWGASARAGCLGAGLRGLGAGGPRGCPGVGGARHRVPPAAAAPRARLSALASDGRRSSAGGSARGARGGGGAPRRAARRARAARAPRQCRPRGWCCAG